MANDIEKDLQQQLEFQKQIAQLETMAKSYMTKEAISRYGNLKAAHPEKAIQIITIIAQLVQAGRIKEKLTDDELKDLLLKLQQQKTTFKIRR